jgi:hypothetical protein
VYGDDISYVSFVLSKCRVAYIEITITPVATTQENKMKGG